MRLSMTCFQQESVTNKGQSAFPRANYLPRSTANSSVRISTSIAQTYSTSTGVKWKLQHVYLRALRFFPVSSTPALPHTPFILHLFFALRLLYSLLLKHSSPLWTLASNTIPIHSFPSPATSCQLIILNVFKSPSTSSVLSSRGLPRSVHSGCQYFAAFFRYSSLQYFHTIIIQATLYILQYLPPVLSLSVLPLALLYF